MAGTAGRVVVVDPVDGKPREVDAAEAQQGFVGGKYQLPTDQEVHVTAPDGTTMIAPADKVQGALDAGWRFATKDEVLKKQAEGQKTQAFLEGAASQLTLGTSDLALREAGVEGLKERRDTAMGTAGEVLGFGAGLFGPGLLDKAAGGAAKGIAAHAVEGALAPMTGLMKAGDAVEVAARKALEGTIENQAAARALAAAAGRGVEGAAFGAGNALSEEALGDPDANAQSYLAAAGAGALLGFVAGGVAGGGLRAFGDAAEHRAYVAGRKAQAASVGAKSYRTPEEFQAALEAANGETYGDEASKGIKGWLYKAVKKASAAITGADEADIDAVNSAFGQAVLREGKPALENAGRQMVDVMDHIADVQKKSSELGYGAVRQELMGELMPKGATGAVVGDAGRAIENLRGQLDAIARDGAYMGLGEAGGASAVKPFRDAIDAAEDRLFKKAGVSREYTERRMVPVQPAEQRAVEGELEYPPPPDVTPESRQLPAGEVPSAPNSISPEAPSRPAAPPRGPEMPGETSYVEEIEQKRRSLKDLADSSFAIPDKFVHEVYNELDHIKQLLQKPGKYGVELSDAASRDLRARFRDAYSAVANHLEDSSVYGKAADLQREINAAFTARSRAFEELQNHFKFVDGKFDPSSISSYLDKFGRLRGDRAVEALDSWQAANRKFADVLDKNFVGQSLGADAKVFDRKFGALRKDLEGKISVLAAARRMRARSQEQFGFGGNGGALAGAVLGGFSPLGVVGGILGEAILNPGRAAQIRANLGAAVRRVSDHINARTERLVTGAKIAVPELPASARMVSRTTLAMLQGSPEDRRKAYEKRVDEISQLSDPRVFGDHVAQQTLGLDEHVPKHAQAVTNIAAGALAVLQASLPSVQAGTTGDGGPFDALYAKPRPHDRDIMKFAQVDHALQSPIEALMDAAERGYIPEHVMNAVGQVYPYLVQGIRFGITNAAGKRAAAPSHRVSVTLNQLMGARVPSNRLQAFQRVHVSASSPSPAPAGTPSVKSPRSAGLLTATDKLDNYPKP